MHRWYEDLIRKLDAVLDERVIYQHVRVASRDLGFEYCAFGMQLPYPLTSPRVVLMNNYSEQWKAHYEQNKYLAVDPTVAHGYRSAEPILWNDAAFAANPQMWDEAQSHGLRHGWSQSSRDGSGAASLLTLARSGEPISAHELQAQERRMRWLVSVAHIAFSRAYLSKMEQELDANLTHREIEVLRWSADGKSAAEISAIWSVSKNTVDFHIKNAVKKLQTCNKTAAVARAVMLGLLF